MMSTVNLDNLPPEIMEKIFTQLKYDRDTLEALGLTCHILFAHTRPYRFQNITLHDQNFDMFMELTYITPWNSILPHVKRLTLGGWMRPLTYCSPGNSTPNSSLGRDLTKWASQFNLLKSLDIRGAIWAELPQYFKSALLSLRVEHLDVSIGWRSLAVEEFQTHVFPVLRPRSLSISGSLRDRDFVQFYPTHFSPSPPLYIHYLQLYEAGPVQEMRDWLRHCDSPPPVIHLHIGLPKQKDSPYGLLIAEILHMVSPVHLYLGLSLVVQDHFEFALESFTNIQTLRISSIYNDGYLIPVMPGTEDISDIPVTAAILRQFSALQDRIQIIQLDSVCAHLNLIFGEIPDILSTSYPNLKKLILALSPGKRIRRAKLDAWLADGPFAMLRSRGVQLKVKTLPILSEFVMPSMV
ncbi:hypothetical protein P691DRAFT_736983 [Macrolepiota fuliginosa MF-IS2]|uniref:F-box domain-containing protein n=1 Tax=Macrolepiota fuliginosa MF-IS2 TaxID=1400762 RepID=A0A9P5X4Y7_9AGAR|nr:hypothetical protein P691DRAFT_736983 [Macrolepiota fuliginosa MF-IS2]